MKSFALTTFALVLGLALALPAAAAPASHDMVILSLDNPAAEAFLQAHRHQLDIARVKPGVHAEIAVTAEGLDLLRAAGLSYEVVVENLEQHYADRQTTKGAGFGLWHTYSESAAFVDSLRLRFPQVVSEKWSLGQTHNGNDIWAFRVSANPDVDENEPEILIDGMHHAREIMSSEFCIMFAEYLASNYGTDPEVTWLLDNRELYVVPIVNPDGVIYNEQTYPDGGGMWRKNRRNNGDGTYGVDPNRNYPYRWGYDDNGSSPYTSDLTYRGPSAGSEPCIQAMMAFMDSREFITHDTIHTYSNLLLYPWGYTSSPTPHADVFEHMAQEMTRYNGYDPGQPGELLYNVNGGTFDWAYGDLSRHDLIYSFSTEIGGSSDGFWPPESRRGALFQENLWPHIYLMRVAGAYVSCHSAVVSGPAKELNPGQSGTLDFSVENQSVTASIMDLNLTVRCDDPWVQFGAAELALGDLASLATTDLGAQAIPVSVDAGCPDGHLVEFTVTAHLAEGDLTSTLSFMVGQPTGLLVSDFESGTGDWVLTGNWGLTSSHSNSPDYSLTDTPSGSYANETAYSATTVQAYAATALSFYHRYDIEDGWDYGLVEVSTDGNTWITLESFTGTQTGWVQENYDLSDYAGQELYFRFVMDTDYSITEDGWYIDDVVITGAGSDNQAPPTPEWALPVGLPKGTNVAVFNVADPEGQPVTYGFRVYADELCTQLEAQVDDLPAGTGEVTEWELPATLPEGWYWVRAFAFDGEQRSLFNEPLNTYNSDTSGVDDMVISGPALRVLDRVNGGQARIRLGLAESGKVVLDIYDMRGARIRSLYNGHMDAGVRILTWDGRDGNGRHTASGMYFLRMQAGNEISTGKVVVVR